jgi:queuosine precursor transporter
MVYRIFAPVYLAAVVAANLTVAHYGPVAVLPVGFVLVGLSMLTRDVIHEWSRGHRVLRLGALIVAGAGLSYAINADARFIAVASMLAFASSETVDALLYQRLIGRRYVVKANVSNVASSFVDSAVFIGVAFGPLLPLIAAQTVVKIAGGVLWTALFVAAWNRWVEPVDAHV